MMTTHTWETYAQSTIKWRENGPSRHDELLQDVKDTYASLEVRFWNAYVQVTAGGTLQRYSWVG